MVNGQEQRKRGFSFVLLRFTPISLLWLYTSGGPLEDSQISSSHLSALSRSKVSVSSVSLFPLKPIAHFPLLCTLYTRWNTLKHLLRYLNQFSKVQRLQSGNSRQKSSLVYSTWICRRRKSSQDET